MDRVPQFCENLRFRKIVWEELHTKSPIKRLRKAIYDRRMTVLGIDGNDSPRDKNFRLYNVAHRNTVVKISNSSTVSLDDFTPLSSGLKKKLSFDQNRRQSDVSNNFSNSPGKMEHFCETLKPGHHYLTQLNISSPEKESDQVHGGDITFGYKVPGTPLVRVEESQESLDQNITDRDDDSV